MNQGAGGARSDLLGGAGWVVFGLAIIVGAWRMDRFTAMGATLYTMPGLVPGIFGAVLVLLGAVMMLRGWRARRAEAAIDPGQAPRLFSPRMVLMLLLTLGYAAGLIGRVPFVAATFVFLAVFMALFSPAEHTMTRRVGVAVLAAAGITVVTVLVFQYVFLVRLP